MAFQAYCSALGNKDSDMISQICEGQLIKACEKVFDKMDENDIEIEALNDEKTDSI